METKNQLERMKSPSKKVTKNKMKHPIFIKEYEILSSLGEGNTSKVYLVRSIKEPKKQFALKLLREEFLQRDQDSIKSVEQEIQILQGLNHQNIVNIVGYGSDGHVLKPSGREIKNLVYILLEYVTGGLLFDLCQTVGGMGEDAGRYFMSQMMETLTYIQGKGVVHRDLKLENILVDDDLNLKVADFGFATYKKIHKLNSYRGTMTYMAPEIKEGKTYDGRQIDVFSCGVILFIIVQGIFPFKEAKKDEYFYNLINTGKFEHYWKKVGGQNLSDDFKDLILKIFNHDGKKRPTVEEIKNHPWMTKPFSVKLQRQTIQEQLQEKRHEKTTVDSTPRQGNAHSRGDAQLLQLIRQSSKATMNLYKFNDMTDHDIDISPGHFLEELNQLNYDIFEKQFEIKADLEKQNIKLSMDSQNLLVKIKFFEIEQEKDEDEEEEEEEEEHNDFEFNQRLRVRIVKKRGDIATWYKIFNKMKEGGLSELLLAPEIHQVESLDTNDSD